MLISSFMHNYQKTRTKASKGNELGNRAKTQMNLKYTDFCAKEASLKRLNTV